MSTTGVDIIVVAFQGLSVEEQEDAFERLGELRLRRLAGEESTIGRMIRSLCEAEQHVGRVPTVDEYRAATPELQRAGADIEPVSRVLGYFGTWRRAREALALSETTTPRRIEARFRSRRLGKVWRYTEETLREALRRCAEHYGRPPLVAEFEYWRERELELARAQGNDTLHLPTASPYRKRWGTWEAAFVHFGYTPEQIAARLER